MSIPSAEQLERSAALLEATGEYRILRRLKPLPKIEPSEDTRIRRGVFVDVETTGLDPERDEVVELAMVAFDYSLDGCVRGIVESFDALRDPGRPIPPAVTVLTGIRDDMVAGRTIDPRRVAEFIGPATLVIAHNAAFDRKFCERLWRGFSEKAWACSFREVPWADEGFDSARLTHLAIAHGIFFTGHRALHDCEAGLVMLSRRLPRSGLTALAALLESARRPRRRVWAHGAPFGLRAALKNRGYRWSGGDSGLPHAWHIDVEEENLQAEIEFLRREIYRDAKAEIDARSVSAFDRYSTRC